MIVPTIATVVVGFSALLTDIRSSSDATTVESVAALTQQIGQLSDALQAERSSANTLLGDTSAPSDLQAAENTHYQSLFAATDSAIASYHARRAALTGLSSSFTATLRSADDGLADIKAIRDQVVHGQTQKASAITFYDATIDGLLSVRQSSAVLAADRDVNRAMQTANALAGYKEALAKERVRVDDLLLAGNTDDVGSVAMNTIYTTISEQVYSFQVFNDLTTSSEQDYFRTTTEDGTSAQRATIEQTVLQSAGRSNATLNVNRGSWDDLVDSHLVKLRVAEKHFDDQVAADALALGQNEQRKVLIEAGLLLGLVLVAVLIAWFVARSMNRSLRELRHGALAIAQYGLPQAVARLRDPALNTSLSPHQVAQQIADPLPVRSRDEFGQVTEAFNAVHLEAVRTAAEQAALRASVATMFVNLARRSQILVDRLIGHLDRLERGEEDPDRLAELFQLDHLATRMRRNDENLLVLAGADSTRVQREPAALIDVLRAAQSEVEHYTRIEFGVIDRDIEIAAHAVNDLVHLVAELFDNATAFSPPDSTVVVEARRVGDRAVLYVEDHGIGMSADQLADLNERLAKPPMVDVAVSRMMGLVVVARLAVRHGVKVELRPAHERGTIADVLMPTAVLVPRALAGRSPIAGLSLGREDALAEPSGPSTPSGLSTFAPLALESGPTGPARPASAPPANFGSPFDPATHGPGAGRNMPPWSDLTGAGTPAGGHGADIHSPHNGGEAYPPHNGTPTSGPAGTPGGGSGLPQRRATDPDIADEPGRPPVPRQTPMSPEVAETHEARSAAWMAAAEEIDAAPAPTAYQPVQHQPSTPPAPTSAPPPAWPPAPPMTPAPSTGEEEATAPPVPEKVAAALDITSEIPRVRDPEVRTGPEVPAGYSTPTIPVERGAVDDRRTTDDRATSDDRRVEPGVVDQRGADTEPAVDSADRAAAPPTPVIPHADETMELPIFRELESAWFRTSFEFEFGSAPREPQDQDEPVAVSAAATPVREPAAGPVQPTSAPPAIVPQPATAPLPAATGTPGSQRPARPAADRIPLPDRTSAAERGPVDRLPSPESVWRTAADQGWRAAEAAAEPQVDFTTESGLPRRTPMAQLVPGGVEKPTAGVQKRSPEQVRGLLSAYHRGVQRGRSDGGVPNSGNPPHSGKEQE